MHQFEDPERSVRYSNPLFELEPFEKVVIGDDAKLRLRTAFTLRRKWIYEYDLGDSWIHLIDLEPLAPEYADLTGPQCVAGERAGPPDDCGGSYGYADLQEIIKDKEHHEYAITTAWLAAFKGPNFDPEACDISKINLWLSSAFATVPKRARAESWWFRRRPLLGKSEVAR